MSVRETLDRALGETPDPDDALRAVVAALVDEGGCTWAGILFAEDGALVLGPEAGTPAPAHRQEVEILYQGARVAVLAADGAPDLSILTELAERLPLLCLVGWDTGGDTWEP